MRGYKVGRTSRRVKPSKAAGTSVAEDGDVAASSPDNKSSDVGDVSLSCGIFTHAKHPDM